MQKISNHFCCVAQFVYGETGRRQQEENNKRLSYRCGKEEMAVQANCIEILACDGLGIKQEFLCVSSEKQQGLGTTTELWRKKDRWTLLKVT